MMNQKIFFIKFLKNKKLFLLVNYHKYLKKKHIIIKIIFFCKQIK